MRKKIILLLACLAQFMVILDATIVNVALPTIKHDLGLNQSTLQWVVIAYGLMFGGFLLLGGRLGDLLGKRRVLVAGLTLFSIASLVAGLADSATQLIAARAFQGLGAALIAPSALSILAATFAEGKARNQALGVFGAVTGASASVGVLASGLLTDGPGWPWIFFVNIPVGALLIALALKYLVTDKVEKGLHKLNASGAATVTGGLMLFVYGLNKGVDAGWTSPVALWSLAGAAMLVALFAWIEARSRTPLIPFAALKNRFSIGSMLAGFFAFGAFYSFIFTMTFFLQQLLQYSPTETGLTWLVTSVIAFIVSGLTGAKLAARFGVKWLLIIGLSLMTFAALWLTRIPADALLSPDILPALILAGIAVGLFSPSIQIGALTDTSSHMFGLTSGITQTLRELGGVMAIAATSTALIAHEASILSGFHVAFLVVASIAATGVVVTCFALRRAS
jgi:EmrB/QacA subfamily drug resistance transporter